MSDYPAFILTFRQVSFDQRVLRKRTAVEKYMDEIAEIPDVGIRLLAGGLFPVLSRAGRQIVSRRKDSPVEGMALSVETISYGVKDGSPLRIFQVEESLRSFGFIVRRSVRREIPVLIAVASRKSNVLLEMWAEEAPSRQMTTLALH